MTQRNTQTLLTLPDGEVLNYEPGDIGFYYIKQDSANVMLTRDEADRVADAIMQNEALLNTLKGAGQ